jgi:hypothetical protein
MHVLGFQSEVHRHHGDLARLSQFIVADFSGGGDYRCSPAITSVSFSAS